MKKLHVFIYVFISSIIISNASGQSVDWNLIITVDEKIMYEGIKDVRIDKKSRNKISSIEAIYVPGSLKLETSYQGITDQDSLYLSFTYLGYDEKNKYFEYDYEIILKKPWFNFQFMIIHIYNMDKKKYRRRYQSHKNKSFVYDLISPDLSRLTLYK